MIRASGLTCAAAPKCCSTAPISLCIPANASASSARTARGKSSLFALLTGALDPDAGNLDLPAGWRIASVQQEIAADAQAAREFVIDGDTHLRALRAQRALTDDQER